MSQGWWRWPALTLAAFGGAVCVGCGGGQVALPGPSGAHPAISGAELAGLPDLPGYVPHLPRKASYAKTVFYFGNGIYSGSPDCFAAGEGLVIPGGATNLSYAIYAFNSDGYQPVVLDVGLSTGNAAPAWIAVANYQRATWQFFGPYSEDASITLLPAAYLSGAGQFFAAVLAMPQATITCDWISLTYVNTQVADFSISGTILDEHGAPVQGLAVEATPDFAEAYTNAYGEYFIPRTSADTYTVTPSTGSGYAFTPVDQSVVVDGAETGIDFTGERVDVTGVITTASGAALPGVLVSLNPAGSTAKTGADGRFTFNDVAAGNATVEPLLAGYTFEPMGRNILIGSSDITDADFTATGGAPTYSVRGQILESGSPLAGVTVHLSPGYLMTQTDGSGNFAFYGLGNAAYTVKPVLGFYTFAPAQRSAMVDNANVVGADFAATPPPPLYPITGKITDTDYGDGVPVVQVQLRKYGDLLATDYTSAGGDYSFMAADGTYQIQATKYGYQVASLSVTINGGGQVANLTATLAGGPTWENFVNSYVSNYCLQCHRSDADNPVSPYLTDYDANKSWGSASNARIQADTMPPAGNNLPLYQKYFQEWRNSGYPES